MRVVRILIALLVVIVGVAVGLAAWAARHPEIAASTPPDPATLDPALVEQGRLLAAYGNCAECHTAAGGEAYAGGFSLPTPFGVVYAPNITPDPDTGIGAWSEAAFRRAMREGLDREGRHLYPAFPYDHFTRVTDDDIAALYAFLMSQQAVAVAERANELRFPFGIRLLVAGWKFLYFEPGIYQPDPAQDEAWNRGAYLVEGIGHCGACHSPRTALGGLRPEHLGGGGAEGWHNPALDAGSPAPLPWTEDALVNYLLDGWDEDHGIAAGPMKPVVENMAEQSEDDVYAIAGYLVALQNREISEEEEAEIRAFAEAVEFGGATPPPEETGEALRRGQEIFARSCANCHRSGGQTVPLALTTTVAGPDPRNAIHITIDGIQPPSAVPDKSMPAFGNTLSDEQIADLMAFMRAHFTRRPAWENLPDIVREVRGADEGGLTEGTESAAGGGCRWATA